MLARQIARTTRTARTHLTPQIKNPLEYKPFQGQYQGFASKPKTSYKKKEVVKGQPLPSQIKNPPSGTKALKPVEGSTTITEFKPDQNYRVVTELPNTNEEFKENNIDTQFQLLSKTFNNTLQGSTNLIDDKLSIFTPTIKNIKDNHISSFTFNRLLKEYEKVGEITRYLIEKFNIMYYNKKKF
jgi:hypothetical protein